MLTIGPIVSFRGDKLISMVEEKVYSEYASDPDFAELLVEFVDLIPTRIAAMRETVAARKASELTVLVHQLKGACGSYGFHEITPQASELEAALQAGATIDDLSLEIATFLETCSRMTSEACA